MPTSLGPNTYNDSIIFNYDTGDITNSYKGEPTTNLLSSYFNTNYVLAGGEFSQYADLAPIFNTYGYGSSYSYSLSLDMKVNNNGGVLVYMQNGSYTKYSFVYQSVNATKEYQRFKFEGLNANLSTPSETAAILAFYTGYGSGVNPTVKNVQVELKSHSTPYINGTRSATQGLLDISGKNNTITLANSYTSNAQITFDGTDDYIGVGNLGSVNDFTIEIMFKSDSVSNYRNPMDCNWLVYSGGYSNIGPRLEQNSSGNLGWVIGDSVGNYTGLNVISSGMSGTPYHYAAITRVGSIFTSYYNGQQVTSTTFNNWYGSFSNVTFGRGFSASSERWFSGQIPIAKIYNRILTSAEIANNYRQYKSRFNLS